MKYKKRILCLAMIAALTVGFIAGAAASTGIFKITAEINPNINYRLNGEKFVPKDMDGSEMDTIIYNGRSYVPLRAVADALDVPVDWDAVTSTIILGEDKEPEKEYTEEITILHSNQDEASKLASDFMKSHPGVKVNVKYASDYSNYFLQIIPDSTSIDVIAVESFSVKRCVNSEGFFRRLVFCTIKHLL